MKGHKIRVRCEKDEKSKEVKKTGKLRWVRRDETWRNGVFWKRGALKHPETHKESKKGETSDILQHSLTVISMLKPHCLFYSARDAETWGDIT